MKSIQNKTQSSCRGAIMLESLIVFTITIFLLFFVLASFSVLFQRFQIQIVANETAARLAQTYGYALSTELVTGEVTLADVVSTNPYRYFDEEGMKLATQQKAEEYAAERLRKTTFTINVTEPVITAEVVADALGRRHIALEIKGSYLVPFGDAFDYFGFNDVNEYVTYAYADCLDLSNYLNTVDYIEKWASLDFLQSKTVKMINSVLKLFKNIGGLFS